MTTDEDVPVEVVQRGLREILATFSRSGWSGMQLEIHGMRISVGRDGPPPAPAGVTATAPAPAPAPAAAPDAAPAPASAATPAPAAAPAAAASSAPAAGGGTGAGQEGLVAVPSPAVGAFWVAPSPGEAPFVEVGSRVGAEQQLGIVEVMKLMNPVLAPVAGEVVEVCAGNSDVVEYEQPLFRIRPDE